MRRSAGCRCTCTADIPGPDADGWPDNMSATGRDSLNEYDNDYDNLDIGLGKVGAHLWYHDHAMNGTRYHVYAGLAGGYLLRDAAEKDLGLPVTRDEGELHLILQDRNIEKAGPADDDQNGRDEHHDPAGELRLLHKTTGDTAEFFGPLTLVERESVAVPAAAAPGVSATSPQRVKRPRVPTPTRLAAPRPSRRPRRPRDRRAAPNHPHRRRRRASVESGTTASRCPHPGPCRTARRTNRSQRTARRAALSHQLCGGTVRRQRPPGRLGRPHDAATHRRQGRPQPLSLGTPNRRRRRGPARGLPPNYSRTSRVPSSTLDSGDLFTTTTSPARERPPSRSHHRPRSPDHRARRNQPARSPLPAGANRGPLRLDLAATARLRDPRRPTASTDG